MNFHTTVIIPAYNRERFIEKAIESVLVQTLRPDEIIVVDDGSTDRTAEIVRGYESRVKLIQIENNGAGPSRPRNIGIETAKSKYITLLDSDDYFQPTLLERHKQILNLYPDVGLVGQNFFRDRSRTGELEKNDPYTTRGCLKQITDDVFYRIGSAEAYSALCRGNFLTSCTGVTFPKSAWKSVSGFDESLTTSNDYDFFFRVLRHHHLGYIDEPLFVYVAHNQNISAVNHNGKFRPHHYENRLRLLKRELTKSSTSIIKMHLRSTISSSLYDLAYGYREDRKYFGAFICYSRCITLGVHPVQSVFGICKLPVILMRNIIIKKKGQDSLFWSGNV